LYNLLTFAVFPVLNTTGGIYWLGVAYWVFGVLILACMLSCITSLRTSKLTRSPFLLAAALTISCLFMISLSLFVQPRYLMPILPLAMAGLAFSNARTRRNSWIVALLLPSLVILAYWLTGSAPPIREPDDFEAPAYIVNG
jgi:CHASE2 domain-containing sensor protein